MRADTILREINSVGMTLEKHPQEPYNLCENMTGVSLKVRQHQVCGLGKKKVKELRPLDCFFSSIASLKITMLLIRVFIFDFFLISSGGTG